MTITDGHRVVHEEGPLLRREDIERLLADTRWIESAEGQDWLAARNKKLDRERTRRGREA